MRRLEESNVELTSEGGGGAGEPVEDALPGRRKPRRSRAAQCGPSVDLGARGTASSEEGSRLVGQVERSFETIDNLLQTLLDIPGSTPGSCCRTQAISHSNRLFASLKSDFQPSAEKGPETKNPRRALVVRSDRRMLRRILQNIVPSAIRYTR